MTVIGDAFVEVKAKADGFGDDVKSQVGGEMESALGGLGGSAAKLGAAIGGAFAVGQVVDFGKAAFGAAMESQKIAKQTEAVVKSTGQAAGLTADQIGDLAGALSEKNAVDDEAIQTGQNLLLTFTNIKEGVGENDKIFSRSSQVMIDLAAAMGTDVSGGAIQLGKALNDPMKGITALTRVGVTFTDEQKNMIKSLQESGDMAGAQSVILAELEKEFGGSAQAQATATDRMKIAMGNLQEEIGARLIPAVESFSTWMIEDGLPAVQSFIEWMDANVVPVLEAIASGISAVVEEIASWWREHWETIRSTTQTVLDAIGRVIETVLGAIEAFWRTWGGTITSYLQGLWEGIRQVIEGALQIIRGVIDVVMGLIHGDFSRVWDGIRSVISGVWEAINGIVDLAINEVRTRIEVVMRLIAGVFDAAWDGIKSVVGGAIGEVKDTVVTVVGEIFSTIEALPGKIGGLFLAFGKAGIDIASSLANGILSGLKAIGGGATDFAAGFANAIARFFNDNVIEKINRFLEFSVSTGALGNLPGIPDRINFDPPDIPGLPTFHRGGVVPGGGDVLAMLRGGEVVFTPEQARYLASMMTAQQAPPSSFVFQIRIDRAYADDARKLGHQIGAAAARVLHQRRLAVEVRR